MVKAPCMRLAVDKSIKVASLKPEDQAAVALARLYATRLDQAAQLADEAEALMEELDPTDENARRRLSALATRVNAQTVAGELGPKLEAVLTALGLTMKGRAVGSKGGDQGVAVAGAAKLDELRARRAARTNRAASVDSSAP